MIKTGENTYLWVIKKDIMRKQYVKIGLMEVLERLTSILHQLHGQFENGYDWYYFEQIALTENLIAEAYTGLCEAHYLFESMEEKEEAVTDMRIAIDGLIHIYQECPTDLDKELLRELTCFLRGSILWLTVNKRPKPDYGFWEVAYAR